MKGKLTVTGVNVVFFVFTIAFVGFQFLLVPLASIFGTDFITENTNGIILVNEFIIILIPVMVYILHKKINLRETLKFKRFNPLAALLIVLMAPFATLVVSALNTIVIYLLQFIGNIPGQPIPVPQNVPQLIIGILIIACSPALCEELLHRGLILRAYEKRGSVKAIFISGIFFGIFHFDVTRLLGTTLMGFLFAYYVLRTDSIFAGMLAHFLNNGIAELIQYLNRNQPTATSMYISSNDFVSTLLLGAGGFIFLAGLFFLFKKVTEGKYRFKPSISTTGKDFTSIISHWPVIVTLVLYTFFLAMTIMTIAMTKSPQLNY